MTHEIPERENFPFKTPPIGCVLALMGRPQGGSTILDNSPYGNHGTITGATWSKLPSGLPGLDFIAANNAYISCPGAQFDNLDAFSISAWVKCAFIPVTFAGIVGKMDAGGSFPGFNFNWRGELTNPRLQFYTDGGGWSESTTNLSTTQWQQVGITATMGGTTTYYVNGAAAGSNTTHIGITTCTNDLWIGRSYANEYMTGSIRLLHFYIPTILSAPQMAGICNQERHLFGV